MEGSMTLLSGTALDPKKFFREGNSPTVQGSTFDLSIGKIFDPNGKEVRDYFRLRPGEMVQVVSAEVFNLDNSVTGHVTYKTSLTQKGVWALTVGIVDPGWDGPIATTLLNFSRNDRTIHIGDLFLRVSLFKHEPVSKMRKADDLPTYHKMIQKLAACEFPPTFLNKEEIAQYAGATVLERIRKEALVWIAAIALIFTIIQMGSRSGSPFTELTIHERETDSSKPSRLEPTVQGLNTKAEFDRVRTELEAMKIALDDLKRKIAEPAPTPKTSLPPAE
jgi:deoxycytidine triphosphate deaminase